MIIEKGLAISFWVAVGILALLGSMYFNVWAEDQCYPALSIVDDVGNIDYDNPQFYYVCYPTLEERLLGNSTYYKGDVPDYIIPNLEGMNATLTEGNTHTGNYTGSDIDG